MSKFLLVQKNSCGVLEFICTPDMPNRICKLSVKQTAVFQGVSKLCTQPGEICSA